MKQLTHNETLNKPNSFNIVVFGDELRTPQNVGMCFRVAEAFGVKEFYINEFSPSIDNRLVQRTARNTEKKLLIHHYSNAKETLTALKNKGYTIIALEITDNSFLLNEYQFKQHNNIVLVIGSERFGIAPEILSLCDTSIQITMFGQNSSMNVVNSLSVCLYEITKQLSN